jgi:hypothetical protein
MVILSHGTVSEQSGEGKRRQAPPLTTMAERVREDLDGWPTKSTRGVDETDLWQ